MISIRVAWLSGFLNSKCDVYICINLLTGCFSFSTCLTCLSSSLCSCYKNQPLTQKAVKLLAIEVANNLWLTFQVETNRTCLCCFLHRRDIYNEMLNINLSINYFFVLSLPHECSFHWSSCNRVYADIAIHTHLRKGFLLSVYYINTLFAFI